MDPMTMERLIGEVAKRHNVLIGRDDPIFMTVTLHELVLADALAQLQASLAEAKQEIAAGTAIQIETAKAIAEQLITAAADYVAGEVRVAIKEVREEIQTGKPSSTTGTMITYWIAAVCIAGTVFAATSFFMGMIIQLPQCESASGWIDTLPPRASHSTFPNHPSDVERFMRTPG